MALPGSYAERLLAAPDLCRQQLQYAQSAYRGEVRSDQSFPDWEYVVPVSALSSILSDFLHQDGTTAVEALRVIGRVRVPRGSDESRYAGVAELAFRGTANTSNWSTNLTADLERSEVGNCKGCLHRGFQHAYMAIRDGMYRKLDDGLSALSIEDPADAEPQVLVFLTGHSLGGALATLAAYDLGCSARYSVCCVTWGCPRVGDAEFVADCTKVAPQMARFLNKFDPVPRLLSNPNDLNSDTPFLNDTWSVRVNHALQVPQKMLNITGFCHVCKGVELDPESSMVDFLVDSVEAAVTKSSEATAEAVARTRTSTLMSQVLSPHDLPRYRENLESALQRSASLRWRKLPSVGTWLHVGWLQERDPAPQILADSSASKDVEIRDMLQQTSALLKDLGQQGQLPKSLLDMYQQLQEVYDKGPQLLETAAGGQLFQEVQEKMLTVCPLLFATSKAQGMSSNLVDRLLQSRAGQKLLVLGQEQLSAARDDPERLTEWLSSLSMTFGTEGEQVHFKDQCTMLLHAATQRWKDVLSSSSAQLLFQKVGVDLDSDGNPRIDQILEKSQQLLETPEGAEILSLVQNRVVNALPMLGAKLEGVGLSEGAANYLEKLRKTEKGHKILTWGQAQLDTVQNDPQALKNLLLSASIVCGELGEASDTASENSITIESLIKTVEDQCLDFLLEQLPLIDVPAVEGEIEGKEFRIENIQLTKFSIRKENVKVVVTQSTGGSVPGAPDAAEISNRESDRSCDVPAISEGDLSDIHVVIPDTAEKTLTVEAPSTQSKTSEEYHRPLPKSTKACTALDEIIRITTREISVEIPQLRWSFKQKHFPFLQGQGLALAKVSGGCVIISFGLCRTLMGEQPIPCFTLSSCSVVITSLLLEFSESKFSWLYNNLAWLFQETVKEYITAKLQEAIVTNIGALLSPLNSYMQPFWPLLLKTIGTSLDTLPMMGQDDDGAGVAILIKKATGLKPMNVTGGDNFWCHCAVRDRSGGRNMISCATKLIGDTMTPEWNELHLLAPWRKGEALTVTVYDKGALTSKTQGRVTIPSNWFYPEAFDGEVALGGMPGAHLYVQITPVKVEEINLVINQPEDVPLGFAVHPSTLSVEDMDIAGLLWRCCREQLPEFLHIRPGDFVASVATQTSHAAGSASKIKAALECGTVLSITFLRYSGQSANDLPS